MQIKLIFVVLLMVLSLPANAGPWLREKGSVFTSVSVATTYNLDMGNQTYLEYGATEKTTLIVDVGILRPRLNPNAGYATLSFRRALSAPDATSKWAYELGFGAGWIGSETAPLLRAGLTWGRGMQWGDKSGWATVDASMIWEFGYDRHATKVDATVGVNFTDVTTGMLQLYTAHVDSDTIATIAPSLVFNPKASKFRIQVGTESQIGQIKNTALKIGLWREF